jgi:multiple antibiotic resistance protein
MPPPSIDKEPFIVPLAVPLLAGPAVLAAVMLYAHQEENEWITIGAIILAWLASTLILLSATFLRKVLGDRGLIACERLMGLLLILISVQMFLGGIHLFMLHPNKVAFP